MSLAGLTGVVVVVYLVIVVGLGRTPNHNDRSLLALSMAAAAVAALLYGPARQRLTQYANRIVYGEREAPDTVLRTFGSRLSRAIPMDELLLQVAESLRKTLGLATAEVWTGSGGHLDGRCRCPTPLDRLALSPEEETVVARAGVPRDGVGGDLAPVAAAGREDSVVRVAPTTHSGHVLGLIVAVRPPGSEPSPPTTTPCSPSSPARWASPCTTSSSTRPCRNRWTRCAARPTSSRRPGPASWPPRTQPGARSSATSTTAAQQHLVALAVNVRLARQLAETDPEASGQILDQLGVGLQEAVQELRALAHGIYPPLLVDRGIAEALRSAAGRAALATEVEAEGLGRYSPEAEAAVYFCCMEALQNAGKHAGEDATATVRVWQDDHDLSSRCATPAPASTPTGSCPAERASST